MAYISTVDERYLDGVLPNPADYYDASNLLNSLWVLADGDIGYGNLTDVYTTADIDTYSLGILSTGTYTIDVDYYIWDFNSLSDNWGSISRFELLSSTGNILETSYSTYNDISFTVITSDTHYIRIVGSKPGERQYSVSYTKTGELTGNNSATFGSAFYSGLLDVGESVSGSVQYTDLDGNSDNIVLTIWYVGDEFKGIADNYTIQSADAGQTLYFQFAFYDDLNNLEQSSMYSLGVINTPPTGSVTITGTATEGQALTASNTLADIDGLGTIAYQWNRDGSAITDATASTYTLTQDDVGAVITVTASYTDLGSTAESVTSSGTTAVANLNNDPTEYVTITGSILNDLTLSPGSYEVIGTLSVASGVTLTLEPGARLYGIQGQSEIVSAGNIVSIGSSSNPVEIHRVDIELSNSPSSVFKNTIFTDYVTAINFNGNSHVEVDHCAFVGGHAAIADYGGYTQYSITNSSFIDNLSAFSGIRVSSPAQSVVSGNEFINVDAVFNGGYFFGETLFTENNMIDVNIVATAPKVGYGFGTLSAPANWWGTIVESEIQNLIYDIYDLATLSEITYENYKQAPISNIGSGLDTSGGIVNWGRGIPLKTAQSLDLTDCTVTIVDDTSSSFEYKNDRFFPTNTQILSAELNETTEGAVDISDVISQLRHIVGLSELTGLNKAAADNDANGSIDISDVISSLRQIVGLQEAPNARVVDAQGNYQFMFDDSVTELYVVAPGDADLLWTPLELL